MDKELYEVLSDWVEKAKEDDTLGLTIFGKHVTITMDDKIVQPDWSCAKCGDIGDTCDCIYDEENK